MILAVGRSERMHHACNRCGPVERPGGQGRLARPAALNPVREESVNGGKPGHIPADSGIRLTR